MRSRRKDGVACVAGPCERSDVMAVQPTGGPPGTGPRRAELLAALSLAIDLGLGQPMEHMLRSSLLAAGLADRLGLGEQQRGVVFYANLVAWIGCHADS